MTEYVNSRVFGEPIYYSDYNFVSVRNLTKVQFRVWCRLNFCLHSFFPELALDLRSIECVVKVLRLYSFLL